MSASSLLVNVSKLTDCDYESIIQSLITNVDLVWINALALEINQRDVQNKLMALKEAGLVKIWDYEIAMNKSSSELIDRVLTVEQFKENSRYLNDMMSSIISNTMEKSSDYTTFSIENRNMLNNFLTAKFCDAESIIQRNAVRTNIATGTNDPFQLYSKYLFNQTNINSVSGLSVDEILNLRKYSVYFRKKIREQIDQHIMVGDVPLSIIKADCEKLSKEYCQEINSRIKGGISYKGTGKGVALDIASIWVVPVTIFSIAQKLWDAVFNRDQRGFVMYLTTLQNSSNVR